MSRRKFDRQFKISAVKLVQQSGYSRAEAANSLGVTTSHISGWIKGLGHLEQAKPVGDGALVTKAIGDLLKPASSFAEIELLSCNDPVVYFDRRIKAGVPWASWRLFRTSIRLCGATSTHPR